MPLRRVISMSHPRLRTRRHKGGEPGHPSVGGLRQHIPARVASDASLSTDLRAVGRLGLRWLLESARTRSKACSSRPAEDSTLELAASSDPANACSWRASSTCSTTHDSGSDKGNHDGRGGRTVQTSRARPTIPSPGRQERRKTEMVAGGGGADRPRVMSFALLGGAHSKLAT